MTTIRVLVIQGEGRAFSAGGDLQTIGAAAATDTIAPVVGELLKHYHAFIETIRRMPKIVLSSVHGSAAGAGMGLAFVTDLCIAAEDARFTPAYAKIGVSPDGGSTVGMVGTVGTRRALQLFLAEDSFSAQQAHDWGLVARVVPAAELKVATQKFAERLAQNPPAAISGTKSLVYQAAVTPTKQQLDAEEAGIIASMHTDDFRVAVKKFTSKGKRRRFQIISSSLRLVWTVSATALQSIAQRGMNPCVRRDDVSSGRYTPCPPAT